MRTGRTLWTDTARAGINSFPAIAGDTLFVVAGATAFNENPVYEPDRVLTVLNRCGAPALSRPSP